MIIKTECDEDRCQGCMQIRQGRDFRRYFLMKPTPKRKVCDRCLSVNDHPINRVNRASVSLSKSRDSRTTGCVDPVFTKKRREMEFNQELLAIEKEFEL